MTTIDHRILIQAPPDVVWNYVSDITHNPDWQIDCHDVIFLTSRREGPGVRWRYATPSGHECVIAVSAWYNGLGYEYYFVDGVPFRENKGRIRLQEIPEGTIVQWTFTYELGGLLGGMRNALGTSRDVDRTIAESLKTLWQKIKESTGPSRVYEAKSLMRDAPDVEARSNYQPRHPSLTGSARTPGSPGEPDIMPEPPIREDDGQPISVIPSTAEPIIIDEPPIAEGDTRPRIAGGMPAATEAEPVPVDLDGEPEFLDEVTDLSRFEPPRDQTDTQPKHPLTLDEPTVIPEEAPIILKGEETEPLGFTPPETLPDALPALYQPEQDETTAPVIEASDETQPEYAQQKLEVSSAQRTDLADELMVDIEAISPGEKPDTPVTPSPAPETPTPEPMPKSGVSEAATSSIWEVFGIQRPSDTEPTPIQDEPAAEPSTDVPEVVVSEPAQNGIARSGLRIVLRRKLVRVRRS